MTDALSFDGLQTKDNTTLLNEIQTSMQNIFSPNGQPIDFSSASPDGQFTNVLATMGTVVRELITQVYNATDPTKCEGTQQDSKYQLNYLFRKGGTYTTQNIDITVNKTVTLQGLDGSYNENTSSAYTVSDDAGNLWYLIDTTTLQTGTTSLPFRAENMGEVIPTIGTITSPVTIVGGVVNIINTVGATSIGEEQESNFDFRTRRDRSTGNPSGNNIDAIVGNILSLDGVINCTGWVNDSNETDSTGTQAHYIWVIVDGGANTDIAEVIYANKGGTGTRGNVTVPITTVSNQVLNINFDRPTILPFYIKFDLKVIGDLGEVNTNAIAEYIGENATYEIGESVDTSKITCIAMQGVQTSGGTAYALNVEISTGGTATTEVSGSGITGATVNATTFQDVLGDITETYTFMFNGTNWELENNTIDIEDYGITIEGTPENGDIIIVDFTAGIWTDYIATSSLADKYVTDKNKIYINAIQ